MSDAGYDLVFRGECLPGTAIDAARAALTAALRLDATREAQLWSGATVYIRRAADRATAARFQQVFKDAGARLRVVPLVDAEAASPEPPESPTVPASRPAAPPPRKMTLAERLGAVGAAAQDTPSVAASAAAVEPPQTLPPSSPPVRAPTVPAAPAGEGSSGESAKATANIGSATFELAPLGADLLRAAERTTAPPVSVRTEHIDLAAPGGTIPNLEPRSAIVAVVTAPELEVAAVGELLAEPTDFVALPLDLSALSLAPPGVVLGTPREVPPTQIETAHLRLLPQE